MIQFTRTAHYPYISLDAAVGILPAFWDADNELDAITQHDSHGAPSGSWKDFSANWSLDLTTHALQYGDPSEEDADPALLPLAYAVLPLSRQRIIVYPHAWVLILSDDGSFTIDRRD
jgi:hypothetical protein